MISTARRWLKRLFAVIRRPKPPAYIARKDCEHALRCYLCAPGICTGRLNRPDEPDASKPRSWSYGMCIYTVMENGELMRWNMTIEGANEHYRNQAIKQGRPEPTACELTPEAIAGLEH